MLSKDATEKFWGFFGPVLLNIHFKRKIYEMWRDGYIYFYYYLLLIFLYTYTLKINLWIDFKRRM